MNDVVHQIRYGWSPSSLLGTRGMGPVESTLPNETLANWDNVLRDHVWAAAPEPGFTFIMHGPVGALLRKVATPADDGRPGSAAHILLSQQLTAEQALGLASAPWGGWNTPAPSALLWPALEPVAQRGLHGLRARARALPADLLAARLSQLLSFPGEAFTVVGEPDPLAVTCALGDLFGGIPTFASDESDDTGQNLPTAVFLRVTPFSSTTATRRRLASDASGADPELGSFAAAAAEAYADEGLDGIAAIRAARAPADLKEVKAWAQAAQFAPGVLADIGRLPKLNPVTLDGLRARDPLRRIETTAAHAPSTRLARALDPRLPPELLVIFVREAVGRVCADPIDHALLDRVAQLGPLPVDLVAATQNADFGRLATVSRALLTTEDRRVLLEQAAQHMPLVGLIGWIDEQAAMDSSAALAAYAALCSRVHKASEEDARVLVSHTVLASAARRMADSVPQASLYLVTLLRALPKQVLSTEIVTTLAATADPVLLHALDTIATSQPDQEIIHRQIRAAFYLANHLHEPAPAEPVANDSSADPKDHRLPGPLARLGQAVHHRKPM